MFVKMRTDSSVSGRGFKANYTAGRLSIMIKALFVLYGFARSLNCFFPLDSKENKDSFLPLPGLGLEPKARGPM